MADLKISQLTGATTPLAGSEVVPLVQSGSTKKVAVSDLTAGRDTSVKSLTATSTTVGGSDSYLVKANSGTGDQAGPTLYIDNYGPPATGRSDGVAAGKFNWRFSQPSSGALQDGAFLGAFAQGGHGGANTPTQIVMGGVGSGGGSAISVLKVDAYSASPYADNAYSSGDSINRWSAVWAANGTIQTSDMREKTDVEDSKLGLNFIMALHPVSYKWKSGTAKVIRQIWYDETGNEIPEGSEIPENAKLGPVVTEATAGSRTHWGLLAQEVKQAADASSVDFGGWVKTDMTNPESQEALRYDQFIAPLIKAVQEQQSMIDELRQQITSIRASQQ